MRDAFRAVPGRRVPGLRRQAAAGSCRAIALIERAGGVAALAHPPHDLRRIAILQAWPIRVCEPSRSTAPAFPAA